ncbi:MAG: hypothetical protein ACRDA5_16095 [Clostridium sp.]
MNEESNKLYNMFLNYTYGDLMKLFKSAKTSEEQDFYIMLSNMVLQREQKKIVLK